VISTLNLRVAFSVLLLITVAGTVGYHVLEGWSLGNTFYATIGTLGTVGFGDFHPRLIS
jgi:voltage-gated potassium channel